MDDQAVRQAADMRAPAGNATTNTAAPTKRMRVTGTGSTGAANATALTVDAMATIKNASPTVALLIAFGDTSAHAITDAAAGVLLMPGERFDWYVDSVTKFVGMVAQDAASGFLADVWTSSGPRAGET